jgi:hypothetical protein
MDRRCGPWRSVTILPLNFKKGSRTSMDPVHGGGRYHLMSYHDHFPGCYALQSLHPETKIEYEALYVNIERGTHRKYFEFQVFKAAGYEATCNLDCAR